MIKNNLVILLEEENVFLKIFYILALFALLFGSVGVGIVEAANDDIDSNNITNCSYGYDGSNMRITYTVSSNKDPKPKNDTQRVCGGADTLITGVLNVDGVDYGPTTVGRFSEDNGGGCFKDTWIVRPGDTSFNIGSVSSGNHNATFSVTFGDLPNCNSNSPGYTKTVSCQPATFDQGGMLNLPCNVGCSEDSRCASGSCINGQCRNGECPDSNTCVCPVKCNLPCSVATGLNCDSGLTCINPSTLAPVSNSGASGICRDLSCPSKDNCDCSGGGGGGVCNENPGKDEVTACARCDASNNPYVDIYWNSKWKISLYRILPDYWTVKWWPDEIGSATDNNLIQNGQTYLYRLSGWGVTIPSNAVTPNCVALGDCGPAATASPYAWDSGGWAGGLCNAGSAVPSSIVFPAPGASESWVCRGSSGEVPCSATVDPKPDAGICGDADGHEFEYNVSPESYNVTYNQCDRGSSTNIGFPAQGSSVTWYCENGGVKSSQCRATRAEPPLATFGCPTCGTKYIDINIEVPDIICHGCP